METSLADVRCDNNRAGHWFNLALSAPGSRSAGVTDGITVARQDRCTLCRRSQEPNLGSKVAILQKPRKKADRSIPRDLNARPRLGAGVFLERRDMIDRRNKQLLPRSGLNLSEPSQVRHWTKKWDVSKEQLARAVERVGPTVKAVAKELGKAC
jgi:hypothetical protein